MNSNMTAENGEPENNNDAGYVAVLADPPWSGLGAEKHYPTMSTEQICAMSTELQPLLAPDCLLWLWVANKNIAEGMAVLEAWGFEYRSMLTWVKPRLGVGKPLRNMTEHVLLGQRGKPEIRFHSQGTWLFAPVAEHSHKPEELHAIAERLGPEGKRLELFARRPRPGWDIWGNEVQSDVPLGPFPTASKRAYRRAQ